MERSELPLIPWTRSNGDRVVSFKLFGADIAKRLMQPLPIIKHLDELKDLHTGFLGRAVVPIMHQLIFQRAEETLDHRVVVAVTLAAHARQEAGPVDQLSIRATGVQRPLIRVMDQ